MNTKELPQAEEPEYSTHTEGVFMGIPIDVPPPPPPESDSWHTDIFDCFQDKHSLFDVLFCSYCNLSIQANRVLNDKQGMHWPLCATMVGCDYCCLGCSGLSLILVNVLVRHSVRQRYHMRPGVEAVMTDMVLAACCPLCTLCQQHREMTARNEWPGCVLFGEDPAVRAAVVDII